MASLDALLRPRSVAVVGASRTRGTIGAEIFHNLIANSFAGPVYPVNPSAGSVQGVRAYPSLLAIPDPVDLVVIVVPAARVPAVIDECVAKGAGGVLIISAGFGETGDEGKAQQDAILAKVRGAGMRMVGPNCLGLLNADPEFALDATFAPTWPPHGNVAFSSQSGAVGLAILDYAKDLGIGIHQFVSIGNKADVSGNDLIEYWEHDDKVGVILLYLESFGNPANFLQIAKRVSRKKPIVAVKSGRTAAGARAASSHTGSLAGQEVAVDALIAQAGVIRTDTMEELFDVAMVLANQPVPRGNRVALLTNAGGPGIMAADACESRGLVVPPLTAETMAKLGEFLPAEASVKNPVDMIASATPAAYERALPLLLADPNIDAVIVLFVPPVGTEAAQVAAAIRRGGAGAKKTILTSFMGMHGVPAALSSLREGRFPSYAFPEAAGIALAHVVKYGQWLARPEVPARQLADVDHTEIARVLATHRGWLPPDAVASVLRAGGVPALPLAIATSAHAAAAAAKTMGFPVAVKLHSATLTHKTEVGGVVLNLGDEASVVRAYNQIAERLAALGSAEQMQGAVVQPMAPKGVELFVGATRSPGFGALIGFGIGGTAVEVWKDVAFRVGPLTTSDAEDLIDAPRGKALLHGFRGAPPVNRAALIDVLLRVSTLMTAHPRIAELDINPLLGGLPESGLLALDTRIRVDG